MLIPPATSPVRENITYSVALDKSERETSLVPAAPRFVSVVYNPTVAKLKYDYDIYELKKKSSIPSYADEDNLRCWRPI